MVLPAVHLAEEGFPLDDSLADSLNWIVGSSDDFPELQRVLGKQNGKESWKAGDRLVQKDLGRTLRLIAEQGPDVFYKGSLAGLIAAEMKHGGGLITTEDLAHYKAHARVPVHGTFRGYDVYGPPPPSSGGTCLVEMLNILENFDLKKLALFARDLASDDGGHAPRYCDRARYLGDSDFVKVPAFLTGKEYAKKLAASIDLKKATCSEDLATDIPLAKEGDHTTHFPVIDRDGMAVSNTYTLERWYGSRIVVAGWLRAQQRDDGL